MPPSSTFFSKTLGNGAGDSSEICILQGTQGIPYGIQVSVVESLASRDRMYRVNVKAAENPAGWRRLVPADRTESGTTWAVDVRVESNIATFRLVRTKESAAPTILKCKVLGQSAAGGTVTITESVSTSFEAVNQGTYEDALLVKVDGKVGIGTDSPEETLDVRGNVVIHGNLSLPALSSATTGNALYIDVHTGKLSYGKASNTTFDSLRVFGNLQAGNVAVDGDINVQGNVFLNGVKVEPSANTSSAVFASSEPFLYEGPGNSSFDSVPFFALTANTGPVFVEAGGTNNNVFTLTKSGTFLVQVEIDGGHPLPPENDILTYFTNFLKILATFARPSKSLSEAY